MPIRLSTTVSKISSLPNLENASLLMELYEFMKNNDLSERHINNTLKTNLAFAEFLGPTVSLRYKKRLYYFLLGHKDQGY